jgi:N-acetylglucosaminyl-diphospho-decaprenol L-rhamnosyltransferase
VVLQYSSCRTVLAISVPYDFRGTGVAVLKRNAAAITTVGTFVVVDNGPPGALPSDLAERIAPDNTAGVTVVPYQGNRGFGAGCNAGVAAADATPFILLVNPDAEITAGMVDELLATFAANPRLGIASPQLLDQKGAPVETAGTFPTVLGLALGKIRRPTYVGKQQTTPDSPLPQHAYRPVDWVSGAVMMIRREVWDATGGFDPAYFLYYEDIDLCLRARQAGWEVGVVPQATAIHESGGSQWRPGTRSRVERIYFQSQAHYFRTHHGRHAELFLRLVRFPYLATGLRRWYLERFGVSVPVKPD